MSAQSLQEKRGGCRSGCHIGSGAQQQSRQHRRHSGDGSLPGNAGNTTVMRVLLMNMLRSCVMRRSLSEGQCNIVGLRDCLTLGPGRCRPAALAGCSRSSQGSSGLEGAPARLQARRTCRAARAPEARLPLGSPFRGVSARRVAQSHFSLDNDIDSRVGDAGRRVLGPTLLTPRLVRGSVAPYLQRPVDLATMYYVGCTSDSSTLRQTPR
jgi:hypothetical protein